MSLLFYQIWKPELANQVSNVAFTTGTQQGKTSTI
jgi:hypothetical protein